VEATKYTEIGYHGKDVDQMIKDLVAIAINNSKNRLKNMEKEIKPLLTDIINEQILSKGEFKGLGFKFCG
jgi:ATP-dependent HslUV protease ATP-binding subunit HslU